MSPRWTHLRALTLTTKRLQLREDPPENQAILKYESTSTLSDFVYILHETTY